MQRTNHQAMYCRAQYAAHDKMLGTTGRGLPRVRDRYYSFLDRFVLDSGSIWLHLVGELFELLGVMMEFFTDITRAGAPG